MKTADLIDHHTADLTLAHLPFRKFGAKPFFAGPVQTVKCFEDNSAGSTRIALLGDMLAELGVTNGWAGLVINGAIRDSVEIDRMQQTVFALATSLVKSAKEGWGKAGCDIHIGGVRFHSGDWVYGDADGVLHSVKKLV